ncbi:ATP-binding protein [Neobacillus soli]|uniref:ATP-binding protein n=1 Tax=Neobacillus soli TaxID=220688 RepID=UPI000826891B|nr:ATP-binding protein [Neobacillus soli]
MLVNGNVIKAQYKEQLISQYKHNPYIEALPEIYDISKAASRISRKPLFDSHERNLPDHHRIHAVWSLADYIKPMPRHIQLENSISIALRQGYKARNPLNTEWKRQMVESFENLDWTSDEYQPRIRSTASGFALMGLSGVGKSTAVESVLGLYPQVIKHKEYNGAVLNHQTQIVWMKLNCPYNGSLKGLCLDFFKNLDELTGETYYKKFNKKHINVDTLVVEMGHLANIFGLGVLVIDEIQFLSQAVKGGSKAMMNFFIKLINSIGLPVILVGTPASLFLFDDLATARRNEGFGTDLWLNYPKNEIWDDFVRGIWKYQWTKEENPLTPAIEKAIYDCTQGIPDFAIKLYMLTQWQVIGEENEKISASLIRDVAGKKFRLAKPILNAIKNGQAEKLMRYKDIPTPDMKKNFKETVQNTNLKQDKETSSEESPVLKIAKLLIQAGISNVKIVKECAELAVAKMSSSQDFKEAVRYAMQEAWNMEEIYKDVSQKESWTMEEIYDDVSQKETEVKEKPITKKARLSSEEMSETLKKEKEKKDFLVL